LDANFRPGNTTGIVRDQVVNLTITRSRVTGAIGWIISLLIGSSKTDITLATQLTGNLNLNGFTNLRALDCQNNQLTGLDVSGLDQLETLRCQNNQLTGLDVSGNNNLRSLSCFGNPSLKTIVGLESLKSLRVVDCGSDAISTNSHIDLKPINQLREQVKIDFLTGTNDSSGNNHDIGYEDLINSEIKACQQVDNQSVSLTDIPQAQRDQAKQEIEAYQNKIVQINS
jgi:hypothetical protein